MTRQASPVDGGLVVRVVKYDEGMAGLWRMTCAECPLIPHTKALGQQQPECAGGIATNMQGPVQLKACAHLVPDSFANAAGNEITIGCKYRATQAGGQGMNELIQRLWDEASRRSVAGEDDLAELLSDAASKLESLANEATGASA